MDPELQIASLEARLNDDHWAFNHLEDANVSLRVKAYSIVASLDRWVAAWHRWRQNPDTQARPM